jgi:hypothetical protein
MLEHHTLVVLSLSIVQCLSCSARATVARQSTVRFAPPPLRPVPVQPCAHPRKGMPCASIGDTVLYVSPPSRTSQCSVASSFRRSPLAPARGLAEHARASLREQQ